MAPRSVHSAIGCKYKSLCCSPHWALNASVHRKDGAAGMHHGCLAREVVSSLVAKPEGCVVNEVRACGQRLEDVTSKAGECCLTPSLILGKLHEHRFLQRLLFVLSWFSAHLP